MQIDKLLINKDSSWSENRDDIESFDMISNELVDFTFIF